MPQAKDKTAKNKTMAGKRVDGDVETQRKIAAGYAKAFPDGGKGEKNLEAAKYASDTKTLEKKTPKK